MIGYTDKDIDAVAMLRPESAQQNKPQQRNLDELVDVARLERSIYMGNLIRRFVRSGVVYITRFTAASLRIVKKMIAEFKASREALKAAEKLFAMTSEQLEDIGLSHRDIEAVVYGRKESRASLSARFGGMVKDNYRRIRQWQKERAGYAELMALDDRALADLGICRAEIAVIARNGRNVDIARTNKNANDNLNIQAANDDHRQAV